MSKKEARYTVHPFEIYQTGEPIIRVFDTWTGNTMWLDWDSWVAYAPYLEEDGIFYEKTHS